jgi:hypothetical protein
MHARYLDFRDVQRLRSSYSKPVVPLVNLLLSLQAGPSCLFTSNSRMQQPAILDRSETLQSEESACEMTDRHTKSQPLFIMDAPMHAPDSCSAEEVIVGPALSEAPEADIGPRDLSSTKSPQQPGGQALTTCPSSSPKKDVVAETSGIVSTTMKQWTFQRSQRLPNNSNVLSSPSSDDPNGAYASREVKPMMDWKCLNFGHITDVEKAVMCEDFFSRQVRVGQIYCS